LQIVTGANLHVYADALKAHIISDKTKTLREAAVGEIRKASNPDDIGIELARKIHDLNERYQPSENKYRLGEAAIQLLTRIEAGEKPSGLIHTGIGSVDRLCGGLLPGEYVVVAGRPSAGKTTFALNCAANVARSHIRVGFISLEMSGAPISSKIVSMVSGCNTKQALRDPSEIPEYLRAQLLECAGQVASLCNAFDFYDYNDLQSEIAAVCRVMRQAVKNGAKLLVLDYLQLIECDGENRQQQVSRISRTIKGQLARLGVPGLILCQLSRANEQENRPPRMSDLRESGAIEQDADLIWFLHNEGALDRTIRNIRFIQAKGRMSGVGCALLAYNVDSQKFYEVEQ
jgi:replicative DNA helicase